VPFEISNHQDTRILKLQGVVTIQQAHELGARIAEAIEEGAPGSPILVETQSLEDIDTCVLQLLCSLRKTVEAVSFANPSEVFVKAIERCGLRREFIGAREGL